MKLYIPRLGDEIRLTSDWQFDLYHEYRNETLLEINLSPYDGMLRNTPVPCVIPAGAVLKVNRIYIRRGAPEYDSVTFSWKGKSTPARTVTEMRTVNWRSPVQEPYTYKVSKKQVRFWVKLDDVNNVEFEKV